MINIEQPAMAINDKRLCTKETKIPSRLQMWNTRDVDGTDNSNWILLNVASVARTAQGGKLKNLIFNCHGSPGNLLLGTGLGISNVALFSSLVGLVDTIWLHACEVAEKPNCNLFCANNGEEFVSKIAANAKCYVIAPTKIQTMLAKTYPFGVIDYFEGLVKMFGPKGEFVSDLSYSDDWLGE